MKFAEKPTQETILIVDDDCILRDLIIGEMKRAGYKAAGSPNYAEALSRIKADPPTVLLVDQKLPDLSGQDLIAALLSEGIKVPFIVITGQGDERLAVEMMKLGAADYLVKDIDFLDLLPLAVKRVLNTVKKEQALRDLEEQYCSLTENIPIGIYRSTPGPEGRLLMANSALLEMLGVES